MKNIILYFLISFTLLSYAQVPCEDGFAGEFPCNDYDLMSRITLAEMNAGSGNDSWGWTDPLDGKEYALMGLNNGTAFIDVTNPTTPIYIGKLPTHTVNSSWRDIKVYNNYAFIVSEANNHGMQVFDLSRLRNPSNIPITFTEDAHFDGFGNAHNIVINEDSAYAYAVGTQTFNGGAHFVDISDPLNPVDAGGYAGSNYSHDAQVVIYNGPDPDYQGVEIFLGSNEDELVFVDVSDKQNPTLISNIAYSNIGYTHQSWLTENQRYFLMGDELDEINFGFNTRTIIFDLQDLDNPVLHMEYTGPTPAIDHNGYTLGDKFFLSNYNAGFRVLDISDVSNMNISEIGFFDTYPENNAAGFNGVWNIYPYFESGNIVVSDINRGFFLVRQSNTLNQDTFSPQQIDIYPNPVQNFLNLKFQAKTPQKLQLFNTLGQKLIDMTVSQSTRIDMSQFKPGLYLLNINGQITKKIIKL